MTGDLIGIDTEKTGGSDIRIGYHSPKHQKKMSKTTVNINQVGGVSKFSMCKGSNTNTSENILTLTNTRVIKTTMGTLLISDPLLEVATF